MRKYNPKNVTFKATLRLMKASLPLIDLSSQAAERLPGPVSSRVQSGQKKERKATTTKHPDHEGFLKCSPFSFKFHKPSS